MAPALARKVELLTAELERALELQGAVENARSLGYGSPPLTVVWMDSARDLLDRIGGTPNV